VGLLALATLSLVFAILPLQTGLGVALAIALVKAVLVLAWFMHLVEEGLGAKFFMFFSALLVVILVTLTTLDPLTRAPYPPAPAANVEYGAPRAP
jgi:cytochrome c oxidase subunit 4